MLFLRQTLRPAGALLLLTLALGACKKDDDKQPAPTITGISPASGPVGTSVTIAGNNLNGATSVSFGGVLATTFTVSSSTTVTATVPVGAATGTVQLTTSGGTAMSLAPFTVVPPVTIAAISPTSGTAGAVVTITGTNLADVTAVSFGGQPATYTLTSPTTISVTVPANATTGTVTLTTSQGVVSGPTFTVLTTTDLLTNKDWKLTAATISPSLGGVTDLYATFADCEKDNLLRFTTPNICTDDQGADKCNPAGPQVETGTWSFNASQTKLTMMLTGYTQTYDLLGLTETVLHLQFKSDFSTGTLYTIDYTFTKQ